MVSGEFEQPRFRESEDESPNVGPVLSSCTHRAGLNRRVERAVPQIVGAEVGDGCSDQNGLGVVDGVYIALGEQHRFVIWSD